jgi:TPR repeat protein
MRPQPAATPAPPPRPAAATPRAAMDPALRDAMLRRGQALLGQGDISGARRLLERAADGGSGEAALAMAETYDPRSLAQRGVIGLAPDPAAAQRWYRRAQELGIRIPATEVPR